MNRVKFHHLSFNYWCKSIHLGPLWQDYHHWIRDFKIHPTATWPQDKNARSWSKRRLNEINEIRRRARQKELMQARIEEALEKYASEGPVSSASTTTKKNIVESYRNESYIPKDLGQRIYIDRKNDSFATADQWIFGAHPLFKHQDCLQNWWGRILIHSDKFQRAFKEPAYPKDLLPQTDNDMLAIKSVTFKATEPLHFQEIVKVSEWISQGIGFTVTLLSDSKDLEAEINEPASGNWLKLAVIPCLTWFLASRSNVLEDVYVKPSFPGKNFRVNLPSTKMVSDIWIKSKGRSKRLVWTDSTLLDILLTTFVMSFFNHVNTNPKWYCISISRHHYSLERKRHLMSRSFGMSWITWLMRRVVQGSEPIMPMRMR